MDPWGTPSLTSSRGLENLLTCTNCFHVSQVSFKPAECVLCSPDSFWLKCNFLCVFICNLVLWKPIKFTFTENLVASLKDYKNWYTSYTGKNLFFNLVEKLPNSYLFLCAFSSTKKIQGQGAWEGAWRH